MDKRLALPMRSEKGETIMHNVTADIMYVFVGPGYSAAAMTTHWWNVQPMCQSADLPAAMVC